MTARRLSYLWHPTLEQIDLVKRMAAKYPVDVELAYTSADVRCIHQHGNPEAEP